MLKETLYVRRIVYKTQIEQVSVSTDPCYGRCTLEHWGRHRVLWRKEKARWRRHTSPILGLIWVS